MLYNCCIALFSGCLQRVDALAFCMLSDWLYLSISVYQTEAPCLEDIVKRASLSRLQLGQEAA